MKKMVFLSACLMFAIAAFAEPTVSDVRARQRYPWNGMVDIDYTITGDASGCKLDVIVEDKQSGKRYVPTKFLSTKSVSEGSHRLTWSTEAEGVEIVSTNVCVHVSLVLVQPGTQQANLYYVIDISGGPNASQYPVATLAQIPNGEWSDEYRTSKIVLRRIEAGSFNVRGQSAKITISKPFYIGVFEITQKQYEYLTGIKNMGYYQGDLRPAAGINYKDLRGYSKGSCWPQSREVDVDSLFFKLRERTGLKLDLPTEAQWEYACRAGTDTEYYNGGSTDADLALIARYGGNCNDGRGGYSEHTKVGSYAPNEWGLYDMIGNVWELCLDKSDYSFAWTTDMTDPVGLTEGSKWTARGGSATWLVKAGCWARACIDERYPTGIAGGADGGDGPGMRLTCEAGL